MTKRSTKKTTKPTTKPTKPPRLLAAGASTSLEQAICVRDQVVADLDVCTTDDRPKLVEAYTKAANTVRQLEKDQKRALASFSDDEVIAHVRALPERRCEAFIIAVQGSSLAGKPLF